MRDMVRIVAISATAFIGAAWLLCITFLSAYGVRYWWAKSMLKNATATTQPIYSGLMQASVFHIRHNWAVPTIVFSLLLLGVLLLNRRLNR